MAQKSGFFNALLNAGVYDRQYNADDYCDNLAVIISNGVLRSFSNDLLVSASGLNLTVNPGRAWIKGHYYHNESAYSLPAVTPPTGGSRIDRVILRLDKTITVRSISLQYLQGTAATSPVAPSLTRSDNIFDLCLAEITVEANATSVGITDTRGDTNLCGWVYSVSGDNSFFETFDEEFEEWFEEVKDTLSSVTLFKQYKWETTLGSATNTVQFNIPQYDEETCFFNVFLNGILADDYTASGDIITFGTTLTAGTEVTVLAYKSIDGTDIMSVSDEITQLQNEYAALSGVSKYTYVGTGDNDNIALSQIAEAILTADYDESEISTAALDFLNGLGGKAYLQSLDADAQITIDVVGKIDAHIPVYGSGSSSSRFRYFNFSQVAHSDIRITFDFAKADTIYLEPLDNYNYIIFYGTDLYIKNASVYAGNIGSGCNVQAIAGSNPGVIDVENCKFYINTSGNAVGATNGNFTNCDFELRSSAGNSYCFAPTSIYSVRVFGGRYLAYVSNTNTYTAAVFYTGAGQSSAVTMAVNVNCPTISVANFYQQYLSVGNAGKTIINGVISTMNSTGSSNTITNQVWLSKQY